MFAVEVYAAVRRFLFLKSHSRREAARVFVLSRETVQKMCRIFAAAGLHADGAGTEAQAGRVADDEDVAACCR